MRKVVAIVGVAALALGSVVTLASPAAALPNFTVSPSTLNFPATYIGATSEIMVTVTNVSSSAQTPAFAGGAPLDPTNFGGSQNCAGTTLAPGANCTFTYRYTPKSEGPHSSSTTIGIDGENFPISMSGTGVFPFNVAPTTLMFPGTGVGNSSTLDVVITNVSPVAQTPSFVGGAPLDPANFGASQNCAGKTFAAGDSCQFTYEFTPQALGPYTSTTTIGIDSKNHAITMSGNGVDPTATPTATATATPTATTTATTTAPTMATTMATTGAEDIGDTNDATASPGAPGVGEEADPDAEDLPAAAAPDADDDSSNALRIALLASLGAALVAIVVLSWIILRRRGGATDAGPADEL